MPVDPRKSAAKQLLLCGFYLRFHLGILPAEALHAAGRIHELLLTRKERVAARAYFYVDIAPVGRAGRKVVAACAHNAHFIVSGMDGCLHGSPSPIANP